MNDQSSISTASEDASLAPLLARRELWLLVSAGFLDPYYEQRMALLRDSAFRGRVEGAARLLGDEYLGIELGPGELSPGGIKPRLLFSAFDREAPRLAEGYRSLFGMIVSSGCPPCGIEYEPSTDVTYRSQQMADIAGFYSAFGLEVQGGRAERLDHISVEAEFLYLLNGKEAAATSVGYTDKANICRQARKAFFAEHVGWWLPAFARLVLMNSRIEFYTHLAALTGALSALERVSLELAPFTGRTTVAVSTGEIEAACFECPADQVCS